MSYQNRQIASTDIDRAVRSWMGDVSIEGDAAAGVVALTRAFIAHGAPLVHASRAAAILHRDGLTRGDRWSGRLSGLAELGGTAGVKHHRALMSGVDSDVVIDVGAIFHEAVDEARALRHARAH